MEEDFLYYLEQLEQQIMEARQVPFTDKVMVEEELVYELIDHLRDSMPKALGKAERVLRDRDDIILRAQEQAEETIQGAEAYVEELAEEANVMKLAEQKADEVVREAREVAREIQLGAREYADELLHEVEETARQCVELAGEGRSQLQVAATREPPGEEEEQGD
jgi:vacuolar-type H+-ATPase subunit H